MPNLLKRRFSLRRRQHYCEDHWGTFCRQHGDQERRRGAVLHGKLFFPGFAEQCVVLRVVQCVLELYYGVAKGSVVTIGTALFCLMKLPDYWSTCSFSTGAIPDIDYCI